LLIFFKTLKLQHISNCISKHSKLVSNGNRVDDFRYFAALVLRKGRQSESRKARLEQSDRGNTFLAFFGIYEKVQSVTGGLFTE
jgi:hypothetical protein